MSYNRSVFLCYSHRDKALARRLAYELESRQVRVNYYSWTSEQFWTPPEKIVEKALRDSDAIIIFVGNHGLDYWQEREVQAALDQQLHRELQLIPVLFEGSSPHVMPEPLRSHQFVHWRPGERMALDDLLLRLQRIFEESKISQPIIGASAAVLVSAVTLIAKIHDRTSNISDRPNDQINKIRLLFKQFTLALPQTRINFYLFVSGLAGFILLSALVDQEEIVALGTLNIAIIGMWIWALLRKARTLTQSLTLPKGDAPEV
jgi:hypothetical protein